MVSKEEVLRLAKLSKLSFDDTNIEKFQKDLNDILEYMEELKQLNLDEVEPLYKVLEEEMDLSYRQVKEEISKEDFLKNAPLKDDNFIILPVVVGEEHE